MDLFLFWIKIFVKRFLNLFKSSPVLIIWIAAVSGAFIFAAVNNYISLSLDENVLFITLPFLVIYALIKSIKYYNLMPLLVRYSKSNLNNNIIYARFFLKQALLNNILLIIFIITAYYSLRKIIYLLLFSAIGVLSIIVSFLIMYFKNKYTNEKIKKVRLNKSKINPLIKSALHEYITPDFIILMIVSISLFIIVLIEFTGYNLLKEIRIQFFIYILIAFSIGFAGIVDSVNNINWLFRAIINVNDFKYHFKRTALFLLSFFGLFLLLFIFSGGFVNYGLLLKYLYCLFIILTVTINIAFSRSNILIKFILISINIMFTVWISTLNSGYLLILIIPVIISYIKAKSEYIEWTIL